MFTLVTAAVLSLPAIVNSIGPCHGELCPTADIVVNHSKSGGGSSAFLSDYSTNPPQFRFVGLGTGSQKVLRIDSVEFYPCDDLTWSQVESCADICYSCLN